MYRMLLLPIALIGLMPAQAKSESQPPVSISALDDVDFEASIASTEGAGRSYSRPVPSAPSVTAADMGIWKAEPGVYPKLGVPEVETFVVIEGRGTIAIEGVGNRPLEPGTVVTIPLYTAATITVTEDLRKFAVVTNRQ